VVRPKLSRTGCSKRSPPSCASRRCMSDIFASDPTRPVFGHDKAEMQFRNAFAAGRLHHAWLISGPKGIGKGLFADRAALHVLCGADGEHNRPAAMFAAGSHPDFVRLSRLSRGKDEGSDLARNITVDQIRSLSRLFETSASQAGWRVVLIDSVDDLEPVAANALLRRLEEPPAKSLFLLASHAPDRLLPTIRSRCRRLALAPLADDAMTSALRMAMPDAGEREIVALAQAGEGAPGRALAFRGLDVRELDEILRRLCESGDPTNERRSSLAQALAAKAAQPRYEIFLQRAPSEIARLAKGRRGGALATALEIWENAQTLAASAVPLSLDPHSVVFELASMLAALAPADRHA